MKRKGRIPLLALNIVSLISLVGLTGFLFVAFVLVGVIVGAAGGDANKIIGTITLICLILLISVILNTISLVAGFRNTDPSKKMAIAMIITTSLAITLVLGVSIHFATNAILSMKSSIENDSSYADSLMTSIASILIGLGYSTIYLATILCIYKPCLKD